MAPKRVLIMGDSHYTVNDEGEFCPEEYDRCVTDKEYTRGIINCAIEKGGWKFPIENSVVCINLLTIEQWQNIHAVDVLRQMSFMLHDSSSYHVVLSMI